MTRSARAMRKRVQSLVLRLKKAVVPPNTRWELKRFQRRECSQMK